MLLEKSKKVPAERILQLGAWVPFLMVLEVFVFNSLSLQAKGHLLKELTHSGQSSEEVSTTLTTFCGAGMATWFLPQFGAWGDQRSKDNRVVRNQQV